jgi:hypothetical protein
VQPALAKARRPKAARARGLTDIGIETPDGALCAQSGLERCINPTNMNIEQPAQAAPIQGKP